VQSYARLSGERAAFQFRDGHTVMFHTRGVASFMSAVTPDAEKLTGKRPSSVRESVATTVMGARDDAGFP
jgi:hypothetical protein